MTFQKYKGDNMTEAEAINKMEEFVELGKDDPEIAHARADDLLMEFLISHGYNELVEIYDNVEKWYA